MNRHIVMNNYVISGGRHSGANNIVNAVRDITANIKRIRTIFGHLANLNFYRGYISTTHLRKQTDFNDLLTRKATSSDITSAIARKADKSTTYTKHINNILQQNK